MAKPIPPELREGLLLLKARMYAVQAAAELTGAVSAEDRSNAMAYAAVAIALALSALLTEVEAPNPLRVPVKAITPGRR